MQAVSAATTAKPFKSPAADRGRKYLVMGIVPENVPENLFARVLLGRIAAVGLL
jgi:hypothetical protein